MNSTLMVLIIALGMTSVTLAAASLWLQRPRYRRSKP